MHQTKQKGKKWGAITIAVFIPLILAALAVGLFTKNNAAEAIAFGEDEAVRIMGEAVSMGEFMLYSVDVKNAYDEAMGEGFYTETGINAQGVTEPYEYIVKEEIAESIRMVKTLCAAAEPEYGITLSKEEEQLLEENANAYYDALAENGIDTGFLPAETVRAYIREEYLAGKVYAYLKEQYPSTEAAPIDVGNEQAESQSVYAEASAELVEHVAGVMEKYDGGYRYDTHINWELMEAFPFYEVKIFTTSDMDNALNAMLE